MCTHTHIRTYSFLYIVYSVIFECRCNKFLFLSPLFAFLFSLIFHFILFVFVFKCTKLLSWSVVTVRNEQMNWRREKLYTGRQKEQKSHLAQPNCCITLCLVRREELYIESNPYTYPTKKKLSMFGPTSDRNSDEAPDFWCLFGPTCARKSYRVVDVLSGRRVGWKSEVLVAFRTEENTFCSPWHKSKKTSQRERNTLHFFYCCLQAEGKKFLT